MKHATATTIRMQGSVLKGVAKRVKAEEVRRKAELEKFNGITSQPEVVFPQGKSIAI